MVYDRWHPNNDAHINDERGGERMMMNDTLESMSAPDDMNKSMKCKSFADAAWWSLRITMRNKKNKKTITIDLNETKNAKKQIVYGVT